VQTNQNQEYHHFLVPGKISPFIKFQEKENVMENQCGLTQVAQAEFPGSKFRVIGGRRAKQGL